MKIKTIIADDHPLFRKGYCTLLSEFPEIELLGEADDGLQLLHLLDHLEPNLVLLDLQMPNLDGIEVARKMQTSHPHIQIIVLTMSDDATQIQEMWQIGAKGYLLKDADPSEVIAAIRAVHAGGTYFSRLVMQKMQDLMNHTKSLKVESTIPDFTKKEVQVLKLLCLGKSAKQIAAELHLAPKTVEHYLERMREKMNAKNTAELAALAVIYKIVSERDLKA